MAPLFSFINTDEPKLEGQSMLLVLDTEREVLEPGVPGCCWL